MESAKDRSKLIRLFRKFEPELLYQLEQEHNGAPFVLIPLLDFYAESLEICDVTQEKASFIKVWSPIPNGWTNVAITRTNMSVWIIETILKTNSKGLQQGLLGQWVSQFMSCELLLPLLKLYDASLQRPILLAFDMDEFNILGITSRSQLISYVATQWSNIKHKSPFNQCAGKNEVLSDLTDVRLNFAENLFPCFSGLCTKEVIQNMFPDVFKLPSFVLGFICKNEGLTCSAKWFFANEPSNNLREFALRNRINVVKFNETSSTTVYPIIAVDEDERILMRESDGAVILFDAPTSVIEITNRRPKTTFDVFLKDTKLPPGLTLSDTGICLSGVKSHSQAIVQLDFSWYRHNSGVIDVEHLYNDACQLLKTGIPRHLSMTSGECTLHDLCRIYGIQSGLDKLVNIISSNRTYPNDVEPIFDLSMIPPDTQAQAFCIHRLTGNFSEFIIGYHNTTYQETVMLSDVCAVSRHNSQLCTTKLKKSALSNEIWVSQDFMSRFSPKDFCFLKAAVFFHLDQNNPDSFKEMLESVVLRVKATDLELLRREPQKLITVESLLQIAIQAAVPNALQAVNDYLISYANIYGAFLIETNGNLNYRLMHSCCCNTLNINWCEKDTNLSVDIPLSNYRQWISKRGQKILVPRLPCIVRVRETNQLCRLITFEKSQNRWTVWNPNYRNVDIIKREEFDIVENQRCLPALVRLLNTDGQQMAKAMKASNLEKGKYIVISDNGIEGQMQLGVDFEWYQGVFESTAACGIINEETSDCQFVDYSDPELFDEFGVFKIEIEDVDDEPAPVQGCQDWVLVNFFNQKDGIRAFVDFLGLEVNNSILYEAYEQTTARFEKKSLSQQTQTHILAAARWLWGRLDHWNYRQTIWITHLKGFQKSDPKTLDHVLKFVYGWFSG